MYVDAVTTAAVVDELNAKIVPGRVQAVLEVDDLSIGLEIYANGQRNYLLMSARPDAARCQLVPDRLRRGVEKPSPLGLLLKKYLDGARLTAVRQPPWERIVELDFSSSEGETRLIVETMDKRSNIILTVRGDVLDSIKRVNASQNRYRVTLPGKPYVPPPPQRKVMPERVTLSTITEALRKAPDEPTWRALVGAVAGVSPLFAREIVFFASGDAEAPAFDVSPAMIHAAFVRRVGDVLSGEWTPCVVPAADRGYVAFAAYPLTQFDGWQTVGSISEAMTLYFGAPVGMDAYLAGKQPVRDQLEAALDRLQRKLAALDRQAVEAADIERLRKQGELILAYGATLEPGQETLTAQYDPDEPAYEIKLDTSLSHVENAQQYFERYEKAKRAAADIPKLKRGAEHEIGYVQQLATDLELAESWPDIEAVRDALQENGYWQGPKQRGPRGGKPGIRRFTTADGFVVLAGRNADQNHTLVTERSGSTDLWLHARGIPGSHVIIKDDGREIPQAVINQAARLAAYYSAARNDTAVDVDVTERRYVKPIKGGKPGMVTYRNERTLRVPPGKLRGKD